MAKKNKSKVGGEERKPKASNGDVNSKAAAPSSSIKDKRFEHVSWDPKFRRMRPQDRKVDVDSRFASMFTDDKFKLKCVCAFLLLYLLIADTRPINVVDRCIKIRLKI
jgi:hypothetical protein